MGILQEKFSIEDSTGEWGFLTLDKNDKICFLSESEYEQAIKNQNQFQKIRPYRREEFKEYEFWNIQGDVLSSKDGESEWWFSDEDIKNPTVLSAFQENWGELGNFKRRETWGKYYIYLSDRIKK